MSVPSQTVLSSEQWARLEEVLRARSKRFALDLKPEHWIAGENRDYDQSISYCYECAEKEIAELVRADPDGVWAIDGGWSTESDSQAFCETCRAWLDNYLTSCGCGEELDHFLGVHREPSEEQQIFFDLDCYEDCYSLCVVLDSMYGIGRGPFSEQPYWVTENVESSRMEQSMEYLCCMIWLQFEALRQESEQARQRLGEDGLF